MRLFFKGSPRDNSLRASNSFLSPSVRKGGIDGVEVEEPANTVTGADDILGNPYEGTAYLSIFSSLLVGDVAGRIEVVVL